MPSHTRTRGPWETRGLQRGLRGQTCSLPCWEASGTFRFMLKLQGCCSCPTDSYTAAQTDRSVTSPPGTARQGWAELSDQNALLGTRGAVVPAPLHRSRSAWGLQPVGLGLPVALWGPLLPHPTQGEVLRAPGGPGHPRGVPAPDEQGQRGAGQRLQNCPSAEVQGPRPLRTQSKLLPGTRGLLTSPPLPDRSPEDATDSPPALSGRSGRSSRPSQHEVQGCRSHRSRGCLANPFRERQAETRPASGSPT